MTTVRNAIFILVLFAIVGIALYGPNRGGGTKDKDGDDGVRVTFTVTVKDFKAGEDKPRVHYRMLNVAPQPEQLSADGGLPVDDDGHYRKSLGIVKKGTYIVVWVTEAFSATKKSFIDLKLYFDGSMVCQATNVTDNVVVCEKEVL